MFWDVYHGTLRYCEVWIIQRKKTRFYYSQSFCLKITTILNEIMSNFNNKNQNNHIGGKFQIKDAMPFIY